MAGWGSFCPIVAARLPRRARNRENRVKLLHDPVHMRRIRLAAARGRRGRRTMAAILTDMERCYGYGYESYLR